MAQVSRQLPSTSLVPAYNFRKEDCTCVDEAGPAGGGPKSMGAAAVRSSARAVAGAVASSPSGHGAKNWPKALAVARQRVFHARRHLRVYLAVHDVVALEFAQVFGEHLFRRMGNELLQLIEPSRAALEMKQDQWLPFAADDFGGELHRAVGIFHDLLRGTK